MLPLILLGLIGISAAAFVFDSGSGAASEDDDPDLTRDGAEANASEGGDTVEGSDIRDLLDDGQGGVNTLNLLGGDDIFEHQGELSYGNTFNGGAGNDVITSVSEYDDTLNGGAGNDTLNAVIGTSAFGGEGDDQINFDQGAGLYDEPTAFIGGGAGNDTINVVEHFGSDYSSDQTSASVTGGDGADTIIFELVDSVSDPAGENSIGFQGEDTSLITIEDFTPGEDALIVDISSFAANGNLDYTGAALTGGTDGDYQLELSFLAEGATNPFTAILNINSASPLALSDVSIIQENASSLGFDDQILSFSTGGDTIDDSGVNSPRDVIEAGAGDDVVDINTDLGTVWGGSGNDEITLGADGNTVEANVLGGAGNDTISAIAATSAFLSGGAGDDEINLNFSDTAMQPNYATGDAGNDVLNVEIASSDQEGDDVTGIAGGLGSDTFNLTTLEEFVATDENDEPLAGPVAIEILDFNPDEDLLFIQPDPTLVGNIEFVGAATQETIYGDTLLSISLQDANGLVQTTRVNLLDVTGFDVTTVESIVRLS